MNAGEPIVSTAWLAHRLGADGLKIIDGSWTLSDGAGPAKRAYADAHIPGAHFFDIDAVADQASALPHMAPTPEAFEASVAGMGISASDTVVIYDQSGLFSAARVWWTFRLMGHRDVSVLDGGLPKWRAEARPLSNDAPQPPVKTSTYRAALQPLVADAGAVRNADASTQIIDARPAARFAGKAPEPRKGLRSGAMPGALNAPADTLVADGSLVPRDALIAALGGAKTLDEPVIATCGSGVAASIVALALETLGHRHWRVYDGSWAEWGRESNDLAMFPVVPCDGSG
ncbi:MAG: sulfurtransferase [Pseudomonadota bacterium]